MGIEIFAFIFIDFKEGVKKHGWKEEIIDTVKVLVIVGGLWVGLGLLLNTPSPISAVASCSMLPNLQKGDFIIVKGESAKAPEISASAEEVKALNGPSEVIYQNKTYRLQGSLYVYCLAGGEGQLCKEFAERPERFVEKRGAFKFGYKQCTIKKKYEEYSTPCVAYIEYKERRIEVDKGEGEVVVYRPKKEELFGLVGDIVHRAVLKIKAGGEEYYITKGDNNPVLDIQLFAWGRGNRVVDEEKYVGKVVGWMPYLGYLKLAIDGRWGEEEQCKTQLTYP